MLKSLFFAFCVLCVTINAAAQDCKYVKVKHDNFTNNDVYVASVSLPKTWRLIPERRGDEYYMGIHIAEPGALGNLKMGSKITCRLGSDQFYDLILDKDNEGDYNGIGTSFDILIKVTKEDFRKFEKNLLTAIRAQLPEGEKTFELSEKIGQKIMDSFYCLLHPSKIGE